ncbi:hypothetical protein BBJ28_00007167 [Nothophytophthora sp. Chile5]|nr:hypothetical protein BBJ28_00007167 [Nothophytophthora sp. Chile5]
MAEEVVRVHAAAQMALLRAPNGRTRWAPCAPPPPPSPPASGVTQSSSRPIELQQKPTHSPPANGAGNLALRASAFPGTPRFTLVETDKHASPPQNLLVFLHGRGDSYEPFARLGAQMALPQTGAAAQNLLLSVWCQEANDGLWWCGRRESPAVVSLRAPVELPFGLGFTWMEDLDDQGDVIPPDVPHVQRSHSLQKARDYLWSFLHTLHDVYAWGYARLFLFGFSQGACVAFHLAMTLPRDVRLGGVILVVGGAIVGPHSSISEAEAGDAVVTPMLQVTGALDDVYPKALAERSRRGFRRRHSKKTEVELFTSVIRPRKAHAMIDSREDMQHVMRFLSEHLYLRNVELENRSDVIELQR